MQAYLYQNEQIIQSLPAPAAVLDGPELKLVSVNEAMLKLWGKDRSVLGRPFTEALPEFEHQDLLQQLNDVFKTGRPYDAHEAPVFLNSSGGLQQQFLDYTYSPLKRESGEVYGVLIIANNVTERIVSRKLLLESEKNFRSLVLHAPVAMCILKEPDYVVEVANEKMFELWGKTAAQVMNKPIFEGVPEVRGQGFEDILSKVYTSGEHYRASEVPVKLLRNGEAATIYVDLVYEAFREADENITGIITVAIDVTSQVMARKKLEEAEERARLAFEASAIGTFDYHLTTNQYVTSPQTHHIFGFIPVSHNEYVERIHPDDKQTWKDAFDEALTTGKLSYDVRILKGEKTSWIRVEGMVEFNEDEEPVRIVGTVTDITTEKNIQLQRDDFIGVASHELKTPITSLKASLQLLSRVLTDLPPRASMLLEQSNQSLVKLSNLIEDLLNVSKLTQGQVNLNKTRFKVADLVSECCNHVRIAGTHEIVFEGDDQTEIYADYSKIDQVIVNLVNNAVKYAPQSKRIKVRAEKFDKATRISVEDKGPGIPAEKIAGLFQRYVQGTEGKNALSGGVGLGLHISAEIIKMHGGEIGVNSRSGKGSSFWFTIPDYQS
ncbi:MAG TPA: ATP-binding protein [Sphingobacteriaceae bacterium]